jgi:hypothetical protein
MFGTVNEAYSDCLTPYVLVKKFFKRKLKSLSVETNERTLLLGIKTDEVADEVSFINRKARNCYS